MLTIVVPKREFYNESTNEFIEIKETTLKLEHSLISISKWESRHKKCFLDSEKSPEEILDYIRCMTLSYDVDDRVYSCLSEQNISDITDYIEDPMSATQFVKYQEDYGPKPKDKTTSELIYYWMISYNIPVEFEKWHINRLLKLIELCGIKNGNGKKMSRNQILSRNQAINQARRAKYNSKG